MLYLLLTYRSYISDDAFEKNIARYYEVRTDTLEILLTDVIQSSQFTLNAKVLSIIQYRENVGVYAYVQSV